MAEFCLDCWNKMNGTKDTIRRYILSEELELYEECGQWKQVIAGERRTYRLIKLIERTHKSFHRGK